MPAKNKQLNDLYQRFVDAGFSLEIRRGEGAIWNVYLLRDGVRTGVRRKVSRNTGDAVAAINLRLNSTRGFRADSEMHRVLSELVQLIEAGAILESPEAYAAAIPA